MSPIATLLRLPRWIERAWQETCVTDELVDSEAPTLFLDDTVPAELLASPDLRF